MATEDFVHALQREGLRRDVDLDALLGVARDVAQHFGRKMQGYVLETGPIGKKETV